MSVQFGACHFDEKPLNRGVLDRIRPVLAHYGPDAEGVFCREHVAILYRALYTTKESRLETQPHISTTGLVLTWDGRLDNREELIDELGGSLTNGCADVSIVAAAYEKWETRSFPKLIGDWALSIWNPGDQSLMLAKDFSGVRQLFYTTEERRAVWCTILDPLLVFAGHSFSLEEEYIAGWLAQFPSCELTPYVGVHSVPPASFVRIDIKHLSVIRFWDFDRGEEIRYRTDREYEDHFRFLLSESVRRRLRSDSAVMAELSGGMDSSSIACVADTLLRKGHVETGGFHTISYYNDSEPNWNERPYFLKVEEKLGREGHHIDVSLRNPFQFGWETAQLVTCPASAEFPHEIRDQFETAMLSSGSRVLLTGTGGDEVTGGVPTPLPELQDLLARVELKRLARQLKVWALNKRRPWIHLLWEAVSGFLPSAVTGLPSFLRPAPWMGDHFVKKHRLAFDGYDTRLELFGPLPSFQQNLAAFNLLRRQLGCEVPSFRPAHEKRYPYLDRNLVEFLYAVPRGQVVRPGERRSLMRRALAGIVPMEILARKRKAHVARCAIAGISSEWPRLQQVFRHSVSGSLGFINDAEFVEALKSARHGSDVPMAAIARTLLLEVWLRNLQRKGLLAAVGSNVDAAEGASIPMISAEEIQYERR